MTADRKARIQQRAYHLWLEEGQPHGRHDEHWRRAERELLEEERVLREGSQGAAERDGAEVEAEAAPGTATPRRSSRSGTKPETAAPPKSRPKSPPKSRPKSQSRAARPRPAASPG